MVLWENNGIPDPNSFRAKCLLPPKKREKLLLVPDKMDLERFLDYIRAEGYMIVYTTIKLIAKHGMRIGAFEKMKVRGKKAVTESKGGKHSFEFDDEDIQLLKTCPLNGFAANLLASRVNYHLKQAHEKSVTNERYSAHDFRHYFAIDFYLKNKGILDHDDIILELSKRLGHKHIYTTTAVYLESLRKESL
jgi:integrase